MAQKRMFSNSVVGSDDFLEMPDSSQNLYFHLSMQADDDGFVDNWKTVMRMTGKKEDDLKILIAKSFILPFDTGVLVIKHWRINNYIQKDRYHETIHKEEKQKLILDESNVYNMYTKCIPRLDKSRLDKTRIDKSSCCSKEIKDSCVDALLIASESCADSLQQQQLSDSCVDGLQESNANDGSAYDLQKIIDFYNNNITLATPYVVEVFDDYLKEMPAELIIYAIKKSIEANVKNIKYIKGTLNNWSKSGIRTLAQAEEENKEFQKRKNKKIEKEFQKEELQDLENLYE